MKIGGLDPATLPVEEVLVLPRGDQQIVFRATGLKDMETFKKVCPEPEPPKKLVKGGTIVADTEDNGYQDALADYHKRRIAYIVVHSLQPSEIESRATFAPLASQVEFALAYSPVAGAPNRIDIGIGASPGDNGTFERGETPGLYSFTYSTTLPHLIINEYYNANTFLNPEGKPYFRLKDPGPYHFQEKGKAAFLKHAGEVSLPDVRPFVSIQQYVVG